MDANDAQTNLDASGIVPAPPRESQGWAAWLQVGLLVLVVGAMAYWGNRPVRVWLWKREHDRAQAAVDTGRWSEAETRAQRMIRLLRRHETGWILWSKAHLALASPEDVIRKVSPVCAHLERPGPLAWILTVAEAELGHNDAARKWLELALQDDELMDALGNDPAVLEILERLRPRGTNAMAYA